MNIKFDKDKLNKEGYYVTYRNGEKPRIVEVVGKNTITSITKDLHRRTHTFDGRYINGEETEIDLLMFQESRSDEDIIRDVFSKVRQEYDLEFYVDDLSMWVKEMCKKCISAIREDERQKHVQDNVQPNTNSYEKVELPVNSGKLPEDIAKEVMDGKNKIPYFKFEEYNLDYQKLFTALVQAGMDAKSDITVEIKQHKNSNSTIIFKQGEKYLTTSLIESGTYYLTPKKD